MSEYDRLKAQAEAIEKKQNDNLLQPLRDENAMLREQLAYCRPDVRMFAGLMEARLRLGDDKPDHGIGVFDVNCLNNGSGWVSLEDWISDIIPYLTENIKRATGGWHITHSIEVTV